MAHEQQSTDRRRWSRPYRAGRVVGLVVHHLPHPPFFPAAVGIVRFVDEGPKQAAAVVVTRGAAVGRSRNPEAETAQSWRQ